MEPAVTGSMDLIVVVRKDLLAIDVNFQVRKFLITKSKLR